MKIIGVSGKRGSGKDTFMNMFIHHYPGCENISSLRFADELKRKVMHDFNLTHDQVYTEQKEVVDSRYNKTPRDILIAVAECYRSIDPDYWVKSIAGSFTDNHIYIITDVRYPNEAAFLKQKGAILVRLERDEKLNVYGKNLDVYGEKALDDYTQFDYYLPSAQNETLQQLAEFAKTIAKEVVND